MTKYFTLGSRLYEDLDDVGKTSPLLKTSSRTVARARATSSSKRNLMQHFVYINSYPTREFMKLPHSRKAAIVKNPYLLLPLALDNSSVMLGENIDYFLS